MLRQREKNPAFLESVAFLYTAHRAVGLEMNLDAESLFFLVNPGPALAGGWFATVFEYFVACVPYADEVLTATE